VELNGTRLNVTVTKSLQRFRRHLRDEETLDDISPSERGGGDYHRMRSTQSSDEALYERNQEELEAVIARLEHLQRAFKLCASLSEWPPALP
jgi:hypothetical protein